MIVFSYLVQLSGMMHCACLHIAFGSVIKHYRGFMSIKYAFALCPTIGYLYVYYVITVVYFCDISHVNSWMLFIFSIVTIYHKSLMHVRSKFTPCLNRVHWAICALLNSLWLEIPTDITSLGICFNQSLLINESVRNMLFSPTFMQFRQVFLLYQIIEINFLFFRLTKVFIFYPVAVTLLFSSEIMMRLFIFENIPPLHRNIYWLLP